MGQKGSVIDIAAFIAAHLDRRPEPTLGGLVHMDIVTRTTTFMEACGATLVTGTATPVYFIEEDIIGTPPLWQFYARHPWRPARKFCMGLLHEGVHWSGNSKRLGRAFGRTFADTTYMREELVAEYGASLLCWDLDICKRPTLTSSKYLSGWISGLPNPEVELSVALGRANQAVAYLRAVARRRSTLFT